MSFGLLGSTVPPSNRNEIFYTSSPSSLAIGKVSISNKNYNPSKVRLGITTDGVNIEYLIYNKFVNYGETFETGNVYLGNGQRLVARSSENSVNFLFYGETFPESFESGMLNSIVSTNTQKKELYTSPLNFKVTGTVSVCNLDSQPGKVRIGISDSSVATFDSSEYLEYDVEIGPNQTYTRPDIKLNQGQTLICSSSEDSNINFVFHGSKQSTLQGSTDVYFPSDVVINGSIGLGTNFAREKLDVIGKALISDDLSVGGKLTVAKLIVAQSGLSVSGIVTGIISQASLNQSLLNLGALPSVDGSALTGVIATGSGVVIQDDDVNVGTAITINFGDNLKAIFSSGITTVTTSDIVNILSSFSAGNGKFSISGSTGNAQVTGTMGIGSTLSVSGNINALNNKVINVGSATSSTDATNKNYVDTRSIAMSIALS